MTMRLCGPLIAVCDLCGVVFTVSPDCPKGTIKHADSLVDCPDANKIFELPPLAEIPAEKECKKREFDQSVHEPTWSEIMRFWEDAT
jgi:hypothetical protein